MKTTPARIAALLAAAVLAAPLSAVAQEKVAPTPDVKGQVDVKATPGSAQPDTSRYPLTFDSLSHDWGRVTDEKPLEHIFKFTNTSDRTITIKSVTATCGCTVPQLAKKVYAPGEAGEIKVQFNPTNRRGPQQKGVTVTLEDDQVPQMQLTLTSHVLPMVWVEPNRVLFQDIFKGTGARQEVTITARKPGFEISSIEGAEQFISGKILKTEPAEDEGDPVTKVTIEVELDKAAPIGTHNTQLVFKSNDEKWPEFKIFVTAMVVGELRADPPTVMIRSQQPNAAFECSSIIDSRNGVPFEITDVEWTVEGNQDLNLVADWESYDHTRGRPTYLLRISGVNPEKSGTVRATVKVKTNLPDNEEITVTLWGTVRGADMTQPQPPRPIPLPNKAATHPTPSGPNSLSPAAQTPTAKPNATKPE
jgi:hypothetical protein